ncbi:4181_t:CDS:2 [Scutellospora calospora]|uniref:4181_t:CDS:1 n=1 Tax=Scutellospora calospora TaxID=85575 RepID=A0ACA9KLK8_9GLOM|nr:4181_t:CDS:2 [Scutellospora calospora]
MSINNVSTESAHYSLVIYESKDAFSVTKNILSVTKDIHPIAKDISSSRIKPFCLSLLTKKLLLYINVSKSKPTLGGHQFLYINNKPIQESKDQELKENKDTNMAVKYYYINAEYITIN